VSRSGAPVGREVKSRSETPSSGPRLGYVLIADGCHSADLPHAPKCLSSDIGTVRVVAQIFGERLFAPIRSREARLYGYCRNGKSPDRIIIIIII
jgi:hypothetical protein